MFFNDNDCVHRGYLKFSENEEYEHSWIGFQHKNEKYAFDPCLNILCLEKKFNIVFESKIIGGIIAKSVKEFLLEEIESQKNNFPKETTVSKILKNISPSIYEDSPEETIIRITARDINHPMYENFTGYIADVEEGQIRKLKAHYYDKGIG